MWSQETSLAAVCPYRHAAAAAREGRAHWKAVPTVLRADVGGRASRHLHWWVGGGGEYNQLGDAVALGKDGPGQRTGVLGREMKT